MGWSGGSRVMDSLISVIECYVHDQKDKVRAYERIIDILEAEDADSLDECLGESPSFDQAFKKLHPDDEDDNIPF